MSVASALAAIGRGYKPDNDALLGTCRLEWGGAEAYGEEAILETFRGAPLDLDAGTIFASAGIAMWSSDQAALFADIYDDRIGRLWRVGAGAAPSVEQALWVPFDTDLHQNRPDLLWRTEDHPWLAPLDVARAETLARRLSEPRTDCHRVRAFVIRAFSDGGTVAVLASLYRLTAGESRAASTSYIAALAGPDGDRIVDDVETEPRWVMRI